MLNMKAGNKNLAFVGRDMNISLTRYNTLSQSQSMVGPRGDITGVLLVTDTDNGSLYNRFLIGG